MIQLQMETARSSFPAGWLKTNRVRRSEHQYDALRGVDALVLVTEWKPFRHPGFAAMKKLMKTPIIFDGRNQYEVKQVCSDGFEYTGIGRQNAGVGCPERNASYCAVQET